MTMLSSLSRAGLATKEGYGWIYAIAILLSGVIAVMSLGAYAELGRIDQAMVCIVSQALAIALAVLARRAVTAQMPWGALAALGLALGCAWWSSHGLALAWYGDAERNDEPMVIFMAALEPGLFLLAEHIKEGREVLRIAHAKAEAEEAEALALARKRDEAEAQARRERMAGPPALPPANVTNLDAAHRAKAAPKRHANTARKVAASIMAASGVAAGMAMPAAADQPAPIAGVERIANRTPTYDDVDRARYELRNRDVVPSAAKLAAHIGCSRQAIWKAWGAGNSLAFDQA